MADTATDFLERLKLSQLLSESQLKFVFQQPQQGSVQLAKLLTSREWLTRWQAQQLLGGKARFKLGKFVLLEQLGAGGMGAVYKARQSGIERIVAIKVMSDAVLDRDDAVQRFLRESQAMAALSHPHIVTAFDVEEFEGQYLLVMEYVAGHDLEHWCLQFGQLPVSFACECILQAALGLQHAHERGLIHRDIKPSNLLVIADSLDDLPRVKLLDLGIARFCERNKNGTPITATGEVLGTPDYMAPDQALDPSDIDIRCDIYSLGCTLYRSLTGEVPLLGETPLQTMMTRASRDAPVPSSIRFDLPSELDSVVMQMIACDRAARYSTPAEVAVALEPYAMRTGTQLRSEGSTDLGLKQFVSTLRTMDDGTETAADNNSLVEVAPASPSSRRGLQIGGTVAIVLLTIAMGLAMLLYSGVLAPETSLIVLTVDQKNTDILVDGRLVTRSPAIRGPVRFHVSKGEHVLEVHRDGYQRHRESFTARDADVLKLDVNLIPIKEELGKGESFQTEIGSSAPEQLAVVKWLMEEKKLKVLGIEKEGRRFSTRTVPSWPFKSREMNLYPAYASPFTTAELQRVRALVDLEVINFAGQPLTDEVLAHLVPLVNLRTLGLSATMVTPAAAQTLRRFPNLEQLQVSNFGSEESMRALAELPKLQSLVLNPASVST